MTDNEIIKALECCLDISPSTCKNCPLFNVTNSTMVCSKIATKSALDLITRQQAEIERLKKKVEELSEVLSDSIRIRYKEVQSEAYQECLAKVKNYIKTHCNPYGKPDFDYNTSIKILNFIDNLKKELVGEEQWAR